MAFPKRLSMRMNFEWTPDQERLMAQYADFGKEVVAPRVQACQEAGEFDLESWKSLAETGFWRMIFPEKYGGIHPVVNNEAWWNFTAAAEGLASTAADGGFILSLIGQVGIIRALDGMGSSEQKAHYFPRLLNGALAATCIAERQGGTDLAGVKTELSGEKGAWRLNGEKWNISHAPDAEILMVAGRMREGARSRLTTMILDADAQGLSRGDPESKMGNRSLPTGWLHFEGVRIGHDNILGTAGRMDALQFGASLQRVYYGLLGVHLTDPIFQLAEDFLAGRSSMGRPITNHQYVQRRLTEALLAREQAIWTGRAAFGKLIAGKPDAKMISSIAKITGSEAAIKIARELTALMGSAGYIDDTPSRILRDVMALVAVGGTEEAHRINIYHQFNRLKKDSPE
jgi:alkylation response protein AidB-like acyl-CoA dehydrogenase